MDALVIEDKDPQRNEPHVRDRRIGDKLFDVVLGEGHEPAVQDRYDRQPQNKGAKLAEASGKIGKQIRKNPYPPIFSSTPAKMTLPAVGALGMGVRQPGVKRKHRQLDAKGQ